MAIKFRLKELIAQKERKEGKKITYRDLKKATGINLNSITAMANNDMSMVGLSTVERLTDYFACDIADLMIKEEIMSANLAPEQFVNNKLSRDLLLQIVGQARRKGKAANLRKADLSGLNLSGADLRGGDFSNTNFSQADLSRANLGGVNLSSANLNGANLSQANLRGANLVWANLSRANFDGADLSQADLYQADLDRANLSGAKVSSEQLSAASNLPEKGRTGLGGKN